jgi:DNA-binding CsgD family transcriptional regulator
MLVFGTQIHVVTFIFILLETGMFIFQVFYYLFRPEDKIRFWYLVLLALLLFYNITGGLFPDPQFEMPLSVQNMIAYGSGFLMASFFPFYFYKAFDLHSLRWHALYGVPLFLMLPYLVFFVIAYAINGNLISDMKYGIITPFFYSLVLLWVILRAIHQSYKEKSGRNYLWEEIAVYCAVTPWAAMTIFSWLQVSQLIEVLCTNTGFVMISITFIYRSIRTARNEFRDLTQSKMIGKHASPYFEENCRKYGLTPREIEIVQYIRQGWQNKMIANELNISVSTVKKHVENILGKTQAAGRVELIYKLVFVVA